MRNRDSKTPRCGAAAGTLVVTRSLMRSLALALTLAAGVERGQRVRRRGRRGCAARHQAVAPVHEGSGAEPRRRGHRVSRARTAGRAAEPQSAAAAERGRAPATRPGRRIPTSSSARRMPPRRSSRARPRPRLRRPRRGHSRAASSNADAPRRAPRPAAPSYRMRTQRARVRCVRTSSAPRACSATCFRRPPGPTRPRPAPLPPSRRATT